MKKMQAYLSKFFNEFNYLSTDAEYLLSVYNKIVKNKKAFKIFYKSIKLYKKSKDIDFLKILEYSNQTAKIISEHEYSVNFLTLACLTKTQQKYYKKAKLPYDLYYNTMLDLRYKLDECKLVKGKVGTFVPNWYARFFSLKLFTFSRLQFEIKTFGKDYLKNGNKLLADSKVLNVHIPRSKQPLSEELFIKSFKQAKEFFKDTLGENPAFVCHSWLLYPDTLSLYSENSNTYKFAKLFDIISTGENENNEDLWRLFDTDEKDPTKLPNDTSIRRAFISHLKSGGKTGWGYGVFFYQDLHAKI